MSYIHQPINWVKKCKRCGLKYPTENDICTHCHGLSDNEVALLKVNFKRQKRGNVKIGKLFILMALIIIIIMSL